ncbi:MAG: lytic transglycosylase domain-containing protein [Acidobacteriia bacterium]|nr:lytic transglycosylase domain-containing protein [Terriglobia bacterium]
MPRVRQLTVMLLLCAAVNVAWSQEARYAVPAASVEEQFSAYQRELSNAADEVLAAAELGRTSEARSAEAASGVPVDERAVQRFARQYWNGEEQNVRRAMERVTQLRATLDAVLGEEGVPKEVAALVLVESGGRPAALSPKGARGVWQFMPETARRYGLTVSASKDERLDVAKSTRAAARYLRALYGQFGDWRLAFAAYNAGEQAVAQAVARAGQRDFARVQLHLPRETRNYVPAVMEAMALLGGGEAMANGSGRSSMGRAVYASPGATP